MSIDPNILIEGAKLFPAPIKSFNNLWDITVGNKIEAWNKKSILKNNLDVQIFKESIENKMSQNSSDKFQEPTLSIIGPALEASKFYIEEEDIRNLFANLIAASMNSDFNNIIHHSFVEIIKQMNPLDAKIINSIKSTSPIVHIISVDSEKTTKHLNLTLSRSYSAWHKNFYFSDIILESLSNSISIDNLIRLGLITLQENELSSKNLYDHFYNSETLKDLKTEHPDINFQLQKSHLRLTNLGIAFKTVCCDSYK
ncbi:MAG: DUF4393 domain-containing protein [Sarcina sp.]